MKIIYAPKGAASEYAELACNIYNGCTHGCLYCYAKRYAQADYYRAAAPKKDAIAKLKKDVEQLDGIAPEILLSFQGDVYQPAEMELRLTRQALEILRDHGLPFTVLTKGGTRATRDFDIMEGYSKSSFGTTLIFLDQADADHYEPAAAPIVDRIAAIAQAKKRGIRTWVSLEPVIDPEQALELVKTLHLIVDFWKVGKINHDRRLESRTDWVKFREQVTELLNQVGAKYYLKKSLTDMADSTGDLFQRGGRAR
jgi:DNA repair photolyase